MATRSLSLVPLNLRGIQKELYGEEYRTLLGQVSDDIDIFYSEDSVADAIEEVNLKAEEEERSVKVLSSIDLNKKTESDLFELLKHREEFMRFRAIEMVHDKVSGRVRISKQEQQDFIDSLRKYPESLVGSLKTTDMVALQRAMTILIACKDEAFKHSFRVANGMVPLAKLLSLPDLVQHEDFVKQLMVVIITLVTVSENREAFRKANGIPRLIPFLKNPDAKIALMATEALLNLSFNEHNQPIIVGADCIDQIFENSAAGDYQMEYESLLLIRNLARCHIGRQRLGEKHLRQILPKLSAQVIYTPNQTSEYKNALTLQRTLLETLFEVAHAPKNQKILGSLGIVRLMQSFFLPMRSNSGTTWNFDVLFRVLRIIDKVIQDDKNRDSFIEVKGIALISAILQKPQSFPEDCVMESASILTVVATKVGSNAQAYGKMGMQILISLLKQFPNRQFIHDVTAKMISNVAKAPRARSVVVQEGGDKVLMMFVRESRVKQVLVNACAGLSYLCSESKVLRAVVQGKTVPSLVGLLQLNQPELQENVVTILAKVAEASESGLVEIVKNGGVVPLVSLLLDDEEHIREQVLLTFGKLLFAPGRAGPDNIASFFQAEGERPLLSVSCILAPEEKIQILSLTIVLHLVKTVEHLEYLIEAGLEEQIQKAKSSPHVRKPGSKVKQLLQLIIPKLAGGERRGGGGSKAPAIYLRLQYQTKCKIVPIAENLVFAELQDIIRKEFNCTQWERLSITLGADTVDVVTQRDLDFILSELKKKRSDPLLTVHPIHTPVAGGANKLDNLLQRLSHYQLRFLLKNAIDQGADLAGPIRENITRNRALASRYTEERLDGPPRGGKASDKDGKSAAPTSSPLSSGGPPKSEAAPILPPMGGPPPPGPPPPPPVKAASVTLKINKRVIKADTSGDLMTDIKNAVSSGGHLRRVELDQNEIIKRGDKQGESGKVSRLQLLFEETKMGPASWDTSVDNYVKIVHQVLHLDLGLPRVAFEVVQKSDVSFQDLIAYTVLSEPQFVAAMLKLGFWVMSANFSMDKTESEITKEFSRVMCPFDLPVGIVVQEIQSILRGNGANRPAGPISGNWDELKEAAKKEKEANAQQSVTGYWKEQEESSIFASLDKMEEEERLEQGGLFDALDAYEAQQDAEEDSGVVKGSWAKKEKRNVGKLW